MQFKQYPSYKNSGVEWLGDVPEHWEVKKIKRLSPVNRGASPRPINDLKYFDDNGEYAWVRISDVTRSNGFLFKTEQKLSLLGSNYSVKLEPESLFLSIAATVGKPCITKIKTCIHDGFVYFPKLKKHRDLLFNIFESKLCFVGLGKLGTQLNLNSETVEDIYIAIPPDSEEQLLLEYIQHETAKIDNLIAKQEKLIQLLEEQRKSIISHAVTKGLDPNAPMKDSGVKWLGEVPEHWDVKSYRFVSKIYRGKFGHRPRNDPSLYDGEYPFIQTGDVARAGKYIQTYSQTLNEKGKAVSQVFTSGTLVMAIAANIGDTAILNFEAYAPDSVVGFKPHKNIDLEFLRFSFIASLQALEQTAVQSTQANLNVERIGALKTTFPPLSEQIEISNYLNAENEKNNHLISKQNQLIEKLKEYRASIISHAVTGKIDVREFGA